MTRPFATLRLQFHKDFTFADAQQHIDYFAALGVSHLYASPITTAQPGSTHGYDTVDYTHVNPELGGEAGLQSLVNALRAKGMGLIIDIVPNHMGVGGHSNAWWLDILEWGRHATHARFFDIDWHAPDPALRGKVLAPFLGESYGDALDDGRLTLAFDDNDGRISVAYYDHRFPLHPLTYGVVFGHSTVTELRSFATRFDALREDDDCQHQAAALRQALRAYGATDEGRAAIAEALDAFKVRTGEGGTEPASGPARKNTAKDTLHRLLERQHYRLASWRTASDEVNWRRFFDISALAGMRVERGEVFDAMHRLVFRLYAQGWIDGVRIDHVDGLADPRGYCQRLRGRLDALRAERPAPLRDTAPYILIEKILARGETMRTDWHVDGTTGYDFLNDVGALLHDPRGAEPLAALWSSLSGRAASFEAELLPAKHKMLGENLAAERDRAARALHRIARENPRTRDYPLIAIRRVLTELVAHYGVYRIYPVDGLRSAEDERYFGAALAAARNVLDRADHPLLDQIDQWLGAPSSGGGTNGSAPTEGGSGASSLSATAQRPDRLKRDHEALAAHRRAAQTLFSQLTAPVAAKSVEDTACYRYGRLLSRNEVGADPGDFALDVASFHAITSTRHRDFPEAMLTTATHDHKRGEDVRARIAVLSEIPDVWAGTLQDWLARYAPDADPESDGTVPTVGAQIMLFQTVVGCWPLALRHDDAEGLDVFAERVTQWQLKALREAKLETSWAAPDNDYETACRDWVFSLLRPDPASGASGDGAKSFIADVDAFVRKVAPIGAVNSLQQTVLRLTAPGVPDLYQGTEWWDDSLVDPDNRRPVDYPARARSLRQSMDSNGTDPQQCAAALLHSWQDGRIKQWLIHRALHIRRAQPALFTHGRYLPLTAKGRHDASVIAFARSTAQQHRPDRLDRLDKDPLPPASWSITIATRHVGALLWPEATAVAPNAPYVTPAQWDDTVLVLPSALAGMRLTDALTGRVIEVPVGGHASGHASAPDGAPDSGPVTGDAGNGAVYLPMSVLLQDLPVAILTNGPAMSDTGQDG